MASVDGNVEVTVALVTRNRRDELARALTSVLCQEGEAEIVVIDDGSTDGTSEMVTERFPSVRLRRLDKPLGPALGRNQAMLFAGGRVVVCLDDDAWLPSSRTVRQTVREFDDPRIAVVAIPFNDILGHQVVLRQQSPPGPGTWVAPTFVGAAYAVRPDAFWEVGGYRPDLPMYSEEADLSLRLLDAGYLTRLGRADPAVHLPSAARSLSVMDSLGRRHEIVRVWSSFPAPWHVVYLVGYVAKGILLGIRVRRLHSMLTGIRQGLQALPRLDRTPVHRRTFRIDRLLRRRRQLPLDVIVGLLSHGGQRWPGLSV